MKTVAEIRIDRLNELIAEHKNQAAFAKAIGKSESQVSQWKTRAKHSGTGKPRKMGDEIARELEQLCGKPQGWMDQDRPETPTPISSAPNARLLDMPLRSADEDGVQTHQIEYWDAKGSCGGGSHNDADALKGYLAKEPTWFQRYNVKPKDAVAIIADGDSMADFIVDGDIVIFDRSKTEPQSGFIYLIQHPDGLRIKQLRRDINGTWILESRNPNKAHYPDEIIPPEKGELLVIKGKFVYRQDG